MFVVHIYAEADSTAPRSQQRMAGYVLEYITPSGRTETKEEFVKVTGTYHAVILQMLCAAASRITKSCELHIHTQDSFVLGCMVSDLPGWASNGYRSKRGTLIKNCREWQQLWEKVAVQQVVKEPGMHTYYNWMQGKMAEEKERLKNPPHSVNTRRNGVQEG